VLLVGEGEGVAGEDSKCIPSILYQHSLSILLLTRSY
jgi:hypothetical protein